MKKSSEVWKSFRIVLIYFIIGILWILLSDKALDYLVSDAYKIIKYETYKGWFYVLGTAILLYFLIKKQLDQIENKNKKLEKSDDYNRLLFNSSPIGLALTKMDGTLVDINSAFANIIGKTISETLKLSYWDITPKKYSEQEADQLKSLELTGKYGPYEKEYIHNDGHLVPVVLNGLIIERDNKKYIWSTVKDVTESKKIQQIISDSEKKLKEKQQIFLETLENMNDGFVSLNNDWIYTYVNSNACKMLNREKQEDLIGKHIWTEYPEGIDQPFYKNYYKAKETGQVIIFEEYYEPWNRWFENRIIPTNEGLSIFFQEITDRKNAAQEIKKSQHILELFVEHAPAAIAMFDNEMCYMAVSKRFILDYDLGDQEIIGKSHYEIFPEISDEWKEIHNRCLLGKTERNNEDSFIRKDGKLEWLRWEIHPWKERKDEIGGIILFSELITEQIFSKQELSDINYRNSILFDYAPIPIWEEDFSAVKSVIENLKKNGISDFNNFFDTKPKELEKLTRLVKIIAVNKKSLEFYEVNSLVQLNSSLNDWFVDESWQVFKNELVSMINGNTKYETEIRVKTPKGIYKHLFLSLNIPPDSQTSWDRVFVSFVDITERKEAQESIEIYQENLEKLVNERTEKLNEQTSKLKESQDALMYLLEDINESRDELAAVNEKLNESNQELEAFTYSVSHDLKAPLRAIDGFSKFLLEDYSDKIDSEGIRLLNIIRDNTKKMEKLILDLLNLSKISKSDLHVTKVNMLQIVNEVLKDIPLVDKSNAEIEISDLQIADVDFVLLKQVWMNLITNALKFSRNKKKSKIEIGCEVDNEFLQYYIKDNGVGFNPEYKNKLFGVFQRLHKIEDFEGTGVGLAIVKRIVTKHGGKVWADGELGKGATFYFSIPIQLSINN